MSYEILVVVAHLKAKRVVPDRLIMNGLFRSFECDGSLKVFSGLQSQIGIRRCGRRPIRCLSADPCRSGNCALRDHFDRIFAGVSGKDCAVPTADRRFIGRFLGEIVRAEYACREAKGELPIFIDTGRIHYDLLVFANG